MNKALRLSRFVTAVSFGLSLSGQSLGQSGAVISQGGAGHAAQASCILLKRMGPADQVTSRLYSFGIRGKQFQYVEGKLPEGFPFHGRLTDHDVRNLQGRGAEIIVLNQNYTADELKQARADCRGETGTTPIQAEAKAAPSQPPAGAGLAPPEATEPAPVAVAQPTAPATQAELQVTSTPDGADIEIDGNFVGNSPSSVGIAPGQHSLRVSKNGYKSWERTLRSSTGNIKIVAVLEPIAVDGAQAAHTTAEVAAASVVSDSAPPASSSGVVAAEARIGISFSGNPTARHDGVEIFSVQPHGPADSIGIQPGDVILAIDGHYLYTIDELRAELLRHESGARLKIQYRHDRIVSENSLTLGKPD